MNYSQIKTYTGCVFPLSIFLVVTGVVLWFMLTDGGWLSLIYTVGIPPVIGFCVVLLYMAVVTPINQWMMTRELTKKGSSERLLAWKSDDPASELYLGPDGLWFNGKTYYWGHSLTIELWDVLVVNDPTSAKLVFKMSEDLGRSPRHFEVETPVPKGLEKEAEAGVKELLEHQIILDENNQRKKG